MNTAMFSRCHLPSTLEGLSRVEIPPCRFRSVCQTIYSLFWVYPIYPLRRGELPAPGYLPPKPSRYQHMVQIHFPSFVCLVASLFLQNSHFIFYFLSSVNLRANQNHYCQHSKNKNHICHFYFLSLYLIVNQKLYAGIIFIVLPV